MLRMVAGERGEAEMSATTIHRLFLLALIGAASFIAQRGTTHARMVTPIPIPAPVPGDFDSTR
jgi:hypothetical protein